MISREIKNNEFGFWLVKLGGNYLIQICLTVCYYHIWLNSWVFNYELSGCGFKSSWILLNFKFCAYFEEGVHDNNIQSKALYR